MSIPGVSRHKDGLNFKKKSEPDGGDQYFVFSRSKGAFLSNKFINIRKL